MGAKNKHRWLPAAFSSAFFYALMAVVTSSLTGEVSSSELTFLRSIGSAILMAVVIVYKGYTLAIKDRRELFFHLINSLFTVSTTYCQIYAFTHMAPADASAIVYGYVALTGLMARIVLKEPFGIFEVTMVICTFSGTILIARPSFIFRHFDETPVESTGYVPPLVAFAAAFISAAKAVTVRAMSKNEDIDLMNIIVYPMIFSAIIIAIPTTIFQEWSIPMCTWVRARVFLFVMFASLANFLSIYAFTIQDAVYVSLILLNDSVLVLLITVIFFGYKPTLTSGIGILLILGSAVAIIARKILAHRRLKIMREAVRMSAAPDNPSVRTERLSEDGLSKDMTGDA